MQTITILRRIWGGVGLVAVLLVSAVYSLGTAEEALPALPKVEIEGDFFTLDGQPFLIKGVSYSPVYPGEDNRSRIRGADVQRDFDQMQSIGINTIVIYRPLDEEVYREAHKRGLRILQGIWTNREPNDFQRKSFKESVKRKIIFVIDKVLGGNNINYADTLLGFFIGAEWDPVSVDTTDAKHPSQRPYQGDYYTTADYATATVRFLAEMCDFGRQYANERYGRDFFFSHINWPPIEHMLYPDFLDFMMFNVYSYWPPEVATFSKGSFAPTSYQGYIEAIKEQYPGKPLIISEFGYSTAPDNPAESGNNERDQAMGLIARWHDIMTAKPSLAGGVIFEWNDEWWKQNRVAARVTRIEDLSFHQTEDPEEWFGLIGIDGPSNKDYTVRPKHAFHTVKRMYSDAFSEDRRNNESLIVKGLEVGPYSYSLPRSPSDAKGSSDAAGYGELIREKSWRFLASLDKGLKVKVKNEGTDKAEAPRIELVLDRSSPWIGDRVIECPLRFIDPTGPPFSKQSELFFDLRPYLHLSFLVRGLSDGSLFRVKLISDAKHAKEAEINRNPPFFPSSFPEFHESAPCTLSEFQKARMHQEWQRVVIPLEYFSPLDLSKISGITLILEDPRTRNMNIAIKDLSFILNY